MCNAVTNLIQKPLQQTQKFAASTLGRAPIIGKYNDKVSAFVDPRRQRNNASPEEQADAERRRRNSEIQAMLVRGV